MAKKCKLYDCCFHDYHKGCDYQGNEQTYINAEKLNEIIKRTISLGCKNEKLLKIQEVKAV